MISKKVMWQKMMNPNFPQFISIEGGDGAGKTTLINGIEKVLLTWGLSVVKTREPGGSILGNEIRNWLLSHHETIKIGAKAELLMFLAARAQHIEELIAPAIAAGKIVLCDRFNDSTIAYQGIGRALGFSYVKELCLSVCGATVPDLTFYLDIDPIIGLERTKKLNKENSIAGDVDRIEGEKIEFHQKVRKAFQQLASEEPKKILTIDASQPKHQVMQICESILENRFEKTIHHV